MYRASGAAPLQMGCTQSHPKVGHHEVQGPPRPGACPACPGQHQCHAQAADLLYNAGSPRQVLDAQGEVKPQAAFLVLNNEKTSLFQRYIVLAVLGRRRSGKSTLLNGLVRHHCDRPGSGCLCQCLQTSPHVRSWARASR